MLASTRYSILYIVFCFSTDDAQSISVQLSTHVILSAEPVAYNKVLQPCLRGRDTLAVHHTTRANMRAIPVITLFLTLFLHPCDT